MKIRQGFVSNSSSASYYVTLNQNIDEALNTIQENCWYPYLDEDALLEILEKYIKDTESRLEDIDKKSERFLILDTKPELESRLKKYQSMKQTIIDKASGKPIEDHAIAKMGLELDYILIKDINGIKTELEAGTSMHNSYDEGMSDFLKDIVLYYSFERPELISLKIEHDG